MNNYRYKSLPEDKAPHGHKFRKGKWYKEDDIEICERGFHCSKNLVDAIGYVTPGWVAKVEVRGESQTQDDKEVWSEMRIVEWYKWTKKDSVSLAIYSAELVLKNYEKKYKDKAPREAIEAAKKVLKNDTRKNQAAAGSAAGSAESAARSAARSARSAARSAAWSARSAAESAAGSARSAAESAAGSAESAAWSAESAAWSARSAALNKTKKQIHNWIIERKFS